MKIMLNKTSKQELAKLAEKNFNYMVKAVVDIEQKIMALDAELHADLEQLLVENGSKQEHLWGINLHPQESGEDFVEFDSMINIKPHYNNRTRGVDDPKIREQIIGIVKGLVE